MRINRKLFAILIVPVVISGVFVPMTSAQAAAIHGDYGATGVFIRYGPYLNATRLGEGFPGQGATIYCQITGDSVHGDNIWILNRDNATGVTGYSADYYMNWCCILEVC